MKVLHESDLDIAARRARQFNDLTSEEQEQVNYDTWEQDEVFDTTQATFKEWAKWGVFILIGFASVIWQIVGVFLLVKWAIEKIINLF